MTPRPFQKARTAAHLYYLEQQPGLYDNDDAVRGRALAGDAPQKRAPHGARALHGLLQARLLPDGTRADPPTAEHAPGLLKTKLTFTHSELHVKHGP